MEIGNNCPRGNEQKWNIYPPDNMKTPSEMDVASQAIIIPGYISLIENTKIQLQRQNTKWSTKYKHPLPSLTLHLHGNICPGQIPETEGIRLFSLDHSFDDNDDDDFTGS